MRNTPANDGAAFAGAKREEPPRRTPESTQRPGGRIRESALLTAQIESAIRRATGDRVRGLRVVIDGDVITISGRSATFYCKQLAQQATLQLLAQETLDNLIEVY